MANDLTKSPLIIDTADANDVLVDWKWTGRMRWVSESPSAGDSIVVQDRNKRNVWEDHLGGGDETASSEWSIGQSNRVDGLIVNTLDSGKLYVYID